ncbi:hypothetical protein Ahy_A09g045084 [Arachis hypogaea]|uniref:Aminotransferase-like plant mobile domain-containing protein n=1 Tax=Arachis hypogaea TaxID=3818 RepID=A0A445BLH8_ARAHY|nr:hypothetical protein Ahy_A09g045084 [Arachis hypogaea]
MVRDYTSLKDHIINYLEHPNYWHLAVKQALRTTEFYHVSRVGQIRGHSDLLSALVEKWRPETHSFVLPASEVTVTLENILHIFGLPIDGEVVTG